MWGSAIAPPPPHHHHHPFHLSSILNSLNHPPTYPPQPLRTLAPAEALLSCARLCVRVLVYVPVDREQAFYAACYLLSISGGQSVTCYAEDGNDRRDDKEKKRRCRRAMGVRVSDPITADLGRSASADSEASPPSSGGFL